MNCRTLVPSRIRYYKKVSLTRNAVKAAVLLAVTCTCLLGAGQVQAQTPIDYYNFNDATSSATTLKRSTTYGDQSPTHLATAQTLTATNLTVGNNNGTTLNAQPGDTPATNKDLTLTGTSGGYLDLRTNTIGYTNITLSFAAQRSAAGFTAEQLSYSTDGTSFSNFGAVYNPPTAFAVKSFDLSTLGVLNNNNNVYLRITFTGGTGGNNRIDNFTLSGNAATPAPPGVVSAGIGFGVTGMSALLRRRKQAKAAKTAGATA